MDGKAVYNRRVAEAAKRCAGHALLFTFTLLLVRKLDHLFFAAWWCVFSPLWLFHIIFARRRFSIPAPSGLHDFHWPPFHAEVATPLLFAFELLLCVYLEISHAVNLKIVFLPLVLLEIIIIVDNFRMLSSPMIEERGDSSVKFSWKKITVSLVIQVPSSELKNHLLHCLIILSMAFVLGATVLTALMLSGDTSTVSWWLSYSVFSVGQCLAFIVCTKRTYPVIDRYCQTRLRSSSPGTADQTKCLVAEVDHEEDQNVGETRSLQNTGGHVMKGLVILFQVLLCMHLQGTPAIASENPFRTIFSPLLLLQGAGVLFSTLQLFERISNLPQPIEAGKGLYFRLTSTTQDFLEFILHGSRLLGWWSIDEADPQILYDGIPPMTYRSTTLFPVLNDNPRCHTYFTFWDNSPAVMKKMSKRDLVEEVWTLQVVLNDLIETTKSSERKHEQLRNDKNACNII